MATTNSTVVDTGLLALSSGAPQLPLHLTDTSSHLIILVPPNPTNNHLPKPMANFLSSLLVVIPLVGSSVHLRLLHSLNSKPLLTTMGSKVSRYTKLLRGQLLQPSPLVMATISKVITKVISSSLLKTKLMVTQPQRIVSKDIPSRDMLNLLTVATRMHSLHRVINKRLVSKDMVMDKLNLGMLLQLETQRPQQQLLGMIIMQLLEVRLLLQLVSLLLCQPLKARKVVNHIPCFVICSLCRKDVM